MPPAAPRAPEMPLVRTPATAVARENPGPLPVPDGGDTAEPTGGLTTAQVLHALRRRWLIALPLAALLSGLVYWGAESRLTPVYTGRTLLYVSTGKRVILYENLADRPDTSNFQRTQIATVKSRLVRQSVVRNLQPLNLATLRTKVDPLDWLEKEINADFNVAPEILRITMKGSDPDELLVILNAVRDSYLREVINKDREDRASHLANLKELAAKHDSTLKTQRQRLASRAEALGGRDLPSLRLRYESLINRVYALQNELLLTRLEVQRAEDTPLAPTAPKEAPTPDAVAVEGALEQALATDAVADGVRKEIVRLEKKVANFELRLLNYQDDPEYKQATAELSTHRTTLSRRRETLRATVTEQLLAIARAQKPIVPVVLQQKLAPSRQQVTLLETEIQRRERECAEVAKGIAELELLRGEIGGQEDQLSLVKSRMQELEVELQAPARAGVIEEAAIVETPKGDRVLKLAVAPACVAFCAVVFLVAWLDLRRGRVNGPADLEAAKIRVLGAVPTVGASSLQAFTLPERGCAGREYTQLTDAIDLTRALIAPFLASARGYTLVVTSAVAGEGKTVLSSHLAVRCARSGLRTLLIDADVRRPKLDRLFGLKRACGFGEWVSGAVSLPEVAAPGPVPGLDVIPVGGCDARTVIELLDLRFPGLLCAAKQVYDVIVIDTAPLLGTPETLALSRLADGVVLSVMRDVSRLSGIRACSEQLASVNARVLGAVVSGAPAHAGSY